MSENNPKLAVHGSCGDFEMQIIEDNTMVSIEDDIGNTVILPIYALESMISFFKAATRCK